MGETAGPPFKTEVLCAVVVIITWTIYSTVIRRRWNQGGFGNETRDQLIILVFRGPPTVGNWLTSPCPSCFINWVIIVLYHFPIFSVDFQRINHQQKINPTFSLTRRWWMEYWELLTWESRHGAPLLKRSRPNCIFKTVFIPCLCLWLFHSSKNKIGLTLFLRKSYKLNSFKYSIK